MAHPNQCHACDGIGLQVIQAPSDLYACGFITRAITCPRCLGSGRTMPQSIVNDHKLASAGDAQ